MQPLLCIKTKRRLVGQLAALTDNKDLPASFGKLKQQRHLFQTEFKILLDD